jgi:hypothetical protein
MHGAIEREQALQKEFANRRFKEFGALAETFFGEKASLASAVWMFLVQPSNRTEVKTCAQ